MEAAPPSYEKATLVDPWDIIARYIPSNELCSAALVCRRWHSTFIPHLWGNPASHFGVENDAVYVALTKFKRTLRIARQHVRSLTHTLHLPPAHAEIHNGPQSDWLRDALERLPNLQSLVVRGLPFFDHAALQALKYVAPSHGVEPLSGAVELPASMGFAFERSSNAIPDFGLRLLDASRCSNVTSTSLAHALGRLHNLLYLDLSFTLAAREATVLRTLKRFAGLQVLKLRGINLIDEALGVLAPAIGRRIRSLDLRNNSLTDRGVRVLLSECFLVDGASEQGQRSPALLSYMGRQMLDIYQGEAFESFIRHAFTRRFVGRLAIEDAPEGGITHLYVAGNQISVEGVSGLLRTGRLHVLDAHSVMVTVNRVVTSVPVDDEAVEISMPGVEKLTPLMAKHMAGSLTFLRIDHSIVTKEEPNVSDDVIPNRCELGDTSLPQLPPHAAELDGTSASHEVYEMPGVSEPIYELPGDSMQFALSPATNDKQHSLGELSVAEQFGGRRGSAFAPEAVSTLTTSREQLPTYSPVSPLMSPAPPSSFIIEPESSMHRSKARTYSSVEQERKARLNAHTHTRSLSLHPGMLPRLRTLVLTNVPQASSSTTVADRIVSFITQCAAESSLARTHAAVDYTLPPGRSLNAIALRNAADNMFALKRLVLELAPEQSTYHSIRASRWHYAGSKSVTEDRDSETLWSAAETDFSFFGDEESSFPCLESGRSAKPSLSPGFSSRSASTSPSIKQDADKPRYDTIALVSAFRKERKMAHEQQLASGTNDHDTEGYWNGIVQVIRPENTPFRADEAVDYYGNP